MRLHSSRESDLLAVGRFHTVGSIRPHVVSGVLLQTRNNARERAYAVAVTRVTAVHRRVRLNTPANTAHGDRAVTVRRNRAATDGRGFRDVTHRTGGDSRL